MSMYVGYISTQKPTIEDLQKISFFTPGPAVDNVKCDTQFFYGGTDDLFFAIYQIRLHDNASTYDNMYFVCEESVYESGNSKLRDYTVRGILTEFYQNFGKACYVADFPLDVRRVFKVTGLNNHELSNLMAQMARTRIVDASSN